MPISYVLINCDFGSEETIMSELKSTDGIDEVHGTFGVYDIIARVSSTDADSLREITQQEAIEYSRDLTNNSIYEVRYIEASAKIGINVDFVFDHMIKTMDNIYK